VKISSVVVKIFGEISHFLPYRFLKGRCQPGYIFYLPFLFFTVSKAISGSTGPIFTFFSPKGRYLCECCQSGQVFNARCNIYILRLCYDASVRLSDRLSVTFKHCGHRVQWIPDIFACFDRWMSLLLTDNASPRSSDGMMPGFMVEEGGVWKNWLL